MDDQTSWTQGSVPQPLDECMYKKHLPKVVLSHFQALGSWLFFSAVTGCPQLLLQLYNFNQFHVQSTLFQTDTVGISGMHLLHIGVHPKQGAVIVTLVT